MLPIEIGLWSGERTQDSVGISAGAPEKILKEAADVAMPRTNRCGTLVGMFTGRTQISMQPRNYVPKRGGS